MCLEIVPVCKWSHVTVFQASNNQKEFSNSQCGSEFSAKAVTHTQLSLIPKGGEQGTVGHDMGSLASQAAFCHLHWNGFIQNIINIVKWRNYFHFPGIISLSCSPSPAEFHHSNSSCRATCNSTTVHKFPLLKSFFGDGFAASQRNEA